MVSQARRMALTVPMPEDTRAQPRLTTMFREHFAFVWRSVRRLGVPMEALDDATQEVFVVASRKLDVIEVGKEKAFLFGTAVRVASDVRRAQSRRRRADAPPGEPVDLGPRPDVLVDHKRARALLDEIIAELSDDIRPVFVLFELESMTTSEIAECLDIPAGTVASRLRRAREQFAAAVTRIERRNP